MTTYTLGDRVLVRDPKRRRDVEAVVVDDRGDSVRVVMEDDGARREVVLKARVRPVPPPRVAPIIPPPGPGAEMALRHRMMTAELTEHAAARSKQMEAVAQAVLRVVPKPPRPWRSEAYLAYVRRHPCCIAEDGATRTSCSGSVVSHHHGPRGMGEKTDDSRTVPLCDGHHRTFHDRGTIDEWSRDALDRLFARVQAELLTTWCESRDAIDVNDAVVDALTAALRDKEG